MPKQQTKTTNLSKKTIRAIRLMIDRMEFFRLMNNAVDDLLGDERTDYRAWKHQQKGAV